MTRIELLLTETTVTHHEDGLLDKIHVCGNDMMVTLIVGARGAEVATEIGGHLSAAGRRQQIPETVSMGLPSGPNIRR